MIQQCPLCQISIGRPANFCRKCGARLSDNSSAARSVELTHHPASSTRAAGSSTSPAKQTRPLSISSTSTHYASSTSRQGSTGRDIRITPRSRQSTAAGLTVIKLLLGLLTIAIILTIVVIIFVKLSPPEQPQEDANPSSRSGSREPFDQPARRVQRLTSRQIEQLRQRALDSLGPARGERTSKELISSLGRLVYPGATPELDAPPRCRAGRGVSGSRPTPVATPGDSEALPAPLFSRSWWPDPTAVPRPQNPVRAPFGPGLPHRPHPPLRDPTPKAQPAQTPRATRRAGTVVDWKARDRSPGRGPS